MFIPGLEARHFSQPEIVLLHVNEGLSKWKWREEQIHRLAVFFLLWLLTSPPDRDRAGVAETKKNTWLALCSCPTAVTLNGCERAKEHGREGKRRTERGKSQLSTFQRPGQNKEERLVDLGRERKQTQGHTHTHTSHRLIASLSFHLSLYLPTLWVRLIQQDGSVRNNCCSSGKLSLYVGVSEVNNRTIPHDRIVQDSLQHTHWGIIHLFFER